MQRIVIEIIGDNPDFAEEMRAKAVALIDASRPGGEIVVSSQVLPAQESVFEKVCRLVGV